MTIRPKTAQELDTMRQCGAILNTVLRQTNDFIRVGRTLKEIDSYIHQIITEQGAKPSFLGYRNYPASSCLSLNQAVVHGIPTDYSLKEGDILGIDVGVLYDGYHTDAAFTKPIGKINQETQKLLAVTQESLRVGLEAAVAGNTVGDIGSAIQEYVASQGTFGIIRDLSGHGIGQRLQELPEILNYKNKNAIPLINGMTLAIEPMISLGDWKVEVEPDEWTIITKDNSFAAHFETTIVIRDNDPEILVDFPLEFKPQDA
jgi:methionyl aminopeptidase